jgi:flavin-dependent dehydrogenase
MKKIVPLMLLACGWLQAVGAAQVVAPLRDVPVLCEVDVVVAGGSSAACAAACAAAEKGARVMLVAPRPYLGDDLCGQQQLWLEAGETPQSELAKNLFPSGRVTTPFTIKSALDQALRKRGVRYLTGCYATDLLVDAQGRAGGVVMVNRSGSQAIRAKVVIDATRNALLARQAGAQFRAFVPGEKEFRFVVVGSSLQAAPGLAGRKLEVGFRNPGKSKANEVQPVFEYTARLPLPDSSYAALARAEQQLRKLVSGEGMLACSEYASFLPADTMLAGKQLADATDADVAAFRPQGLSRLYVLSAYADVSAKALPIILRPLAFLAAGEHVGQAAALEAATLGLDLELRLASVPATGAQPVTIGEPRNVTSPISTNGVISVGQRALPVLGTYDVVVVGGGTAGAPAGIAAATTGARTLVVEYLDELGGVGTAGLVGIYWYGMRGGFTTDMDDAITGTNRWKTAKSSGFNVVQRAEWLRRELVKHGADIWFGSFGCGAVVAAGQVTGVVVATPLGRGVVLAKTVIDATGNADIADCAGAATEFGVAQGGMLSVQLAGYPHRNLGDSVNNTCFALVDDTSVLDVWHLATWTLAQSAKKTPYDIGQLVDSRERRRIVADYMLTTPDILNHRSFPDTISHHKSNFDAAAFPTSPMLLVKDMKGPTYEVDLPYRSLLPKGLDGILATGLGAGAERDAMTLIRMQSDLQNQGYAAGVVAAMAAENGGHTRSIKLKELQQLLVAKGALEARVLTDTDSYPMNPAMVAKAVAEVGDLRQEIKQSRTVEDKNIFSLAIVMAHPAQALPLLRQAHAAAVGEKKITYAKILGILGDGSGVPTLCAALGQTAGWDKGYGLTSHRESDNMFSEMDRQVLALGYGGAPDALAMLTEKIQQLKPESELSHFIASAMALRHFAVPRACAAPLAKLLDTPDFAGHALQLAVDPQTGQLAERGLASSKPDTNLNVSFKELLVAAMLFQCGDSDGRGRQILEQYSRGVEGHFARYAQYLLQAATGLSR